MSMDFMPTSLNAEGFVRMVQRQTAKGSGEMIDNNTKNVTLFAHGPGRFKRMW